MRKSLYVLIIISFSISVGILTFLIHPQNRGYDVRITNVQYVYPWLNITISAYENLPKVEMVQTSIHTRLWEETINTQLEEGDTLNLNLNVTANPITTEHNTGWVLLFYETGERSSLEFEVELKGGE